MTKETIDFLSNRFNKFKGAEVMLRSWEDISSEHYVDMDGDISIRRPWFISPENVNGHRGFLWHTDRKYFGTTIVVEWYADATDSFIGKAKDGYQIWLPFEALDPVILTQLGFPDDTETVIPPGDLFGGLFA